MATRSLIGIQRDGNNVECVYCHWDGYPWHVGRLLFNNFNSEQLMDELVSLGDISSLDKTIKDTLFYNNTQNEDEYETRSMLIPTEKYTTGPAIKGEDYRYIYDLEGNMMCYDVYDDVYMEVESFLN